MSKIAWLVLAGVLCATTSFAHGIHLSVQVENTTILGTVHYSRNNPVRIAQVRLVSTTDDQILEETRTDREGHFSIPIPAAAREQSLDLQVVVDAGGGHRARRTLPASVLYLASPQHPEKTTEGEAHAHLSEEQLRLLVESALQRQLEPLYEQLADDHRHVEVRDVVAGIGYLVGIAGLGAWVRSRRQ